MLQYLGDIARIQLNSSGQYNVYLYPDDVRGSCASYAKLEYGIQRKEPLFLLAEQSGSPSVRYDGSLYSIPTGRCHSSMQALALVTQLIALQRKGTDLPRSTPITVVSP